jgi:PAS domain-containing protein
MVWTTSPLGSHTYYNQTWYTYTGLEPEDSLGVRAVLLPSLAMRRLRRLLALPRVGPVTEEEDPTEPGRCDRAYLVGAQSRFLRRREPFREPQEASPPSRP